MPQALPPASLLEPIRLPPRTDLATVGDMARCLLADEEAIALKNVDLAALRLWRQRLAAGD